ncbi:MAG: malectin domain-containing carbohydrate-binding protein [Candidatus Acidiferrales bacterium]
MTIPKTYARAIRGVATGSTDGAHSARQMKQFCLAAPLALACFGLILLAGCGGHGSTISVEIQPNLVQTMDESQSPCNAPNNLLGCQMINFVASVSGDNTNSGVTWNLSVLSTGCSGAGCGTLINVTTVSVTYVAPPNIAAELTGVMLQAVSVANSKTTTSVGITIALDPTFTTTGLQQCAVGVYCLPSGSNGIAYNSNQGLVVTNGVAPFTFISPTVSTAPIQINAGGPPVPPFVADEDFTGGTTTSSANAINISNVADPAPAAVYQTARTSTAAGAGGAFSYTIGGFTPGSVHLLRLHFCDTVSTAAGQRTFNVSVNGTQVLTSFDIFAAAGKNIAIIEQGSLPANSSGQFVIQFTGVVGEALVNGLEVESNSCLPSTLNIGTLPPGLTLNPGTGAIVGRPSSPTAGNPAIPFQFTVQATDDSATPVSACGNFQITVTPPPILSITTTSLPPGTLNTPFTAPISTSGGVTPITWSIVAPNTCATLPGDTGVLPTGLMLNPASGQITGIPAGNPTGSPASCSFTAQVVDSSLPIGQLQTQLISVTINAPAPLQITSNPTLPAGFTATPYAPLPLIATGGVGPYTWSVVTGQLPAGLVLAPDGTISGTPVLATNPPTDDFFTVQVADSELNPMTGLPAPQTMTQVFNVTISPGVISPNTLLNGQYTLLFHGFDKSGPVTMIGSVIMGGNGVLLGEEDIYRDSPVVSSTPAPLAGVYSIGTDGRGTMELVATSPISGAISTIDYRLVLDSGGGSGHPNVRFFEDNSTNTNNDAPNATHGEGIMKPLVGSSFTYASFSGNYAFGFGGYEAAGKLPVALEGVVHADATTSTPRLTGTCDFNDAGAYSSQGLSGTFSTTVDSFGRGTGELDFAQPGKAQVALHFVFYFVSPTDLYFMENDTSASKDVFYLLSGEMLLQQPGYQFTNAAVAGTSVATGTGLSGSNASVFAGLLTGANFSYDQNNGGTPSSPSFTGTYSVANNGRAAFTGLGSTAATTRVAAAYLTGPGQGFLIGSDTAVTTGLLELQTSTPSLLVPISSSLQGGYTLDTAVPQENLVTNAIGEVYSNGGEFGAPSISGIIDEYDPPSVADPEGLLHLGQSLVSPYTVSGTGRGTLGPNSITGFPENLILYVASPGSFRAISADANPGNGHPTVYFFNH